MHIQTKQIVQNRAENLLLSIKKIGRIIFLDIDKVLGVVTKH